MLIFVYMFSTVTTVLYELKGSSTMNIKYENIKSGWPKKEVGRICKRVEKLVRKQLVLKREFKIGMTTCPERRFREYLNELDDWQKMHVLYYTTSNSNQKQIERELILKLRKKYPKKIANDNEGGAGRPANSSHNYVYVVVK